MTPSVRLAEVSIFIRDGTHGSPARSPMGIPVLSATNVRSGQLDLSTERFTTESEYQAFRKRLPIARGDVLLTIVGSIGRAAVVEDAPPLVFQRSVAVVRPDPSRIDARYLYHATQSARFQGQLNSAVNKSSQAGVYLGKLAELELSLPPLAKQHRIAAILDLADTIRAKRREALAQLDRLAQAIFIEMFGDPLTNPKGWPETSLEHLGTVVTGNTPSREDPTNFGNTIEWIKSDNLNTPHYYLTQAAEGLSEAGKRKARTVPASSVLVTCIAGSPDCIGNCAMADREVAFNQQINAFVPRLGNPHYYLALFKTGKKLIQQASTNGMKGMVSKGRFEQIRVMSPPETLQQAFAERALAVVAMADNLQRSQQNMDALFAALQHRAFHGEL